MRRTPLLDTVARSLGCWQGSLARGTAVREARPSGPGRCSPSRSPAGSRAPTPRRALAHPPPLRSAGRSVLTNPLPQDDARAPSGLREGHRKRAMMSCRLNPPAPAPIGISRGTSAVASCAAPPSVSGGQQAASSPFRLGADPAETTVPCSAVQRAVRRRTEPPSHRPQRWRWLGSPSTTARPWKGISTGQLSVVSVHHGGTSATVTGSTYLAVQSQPWNKTREGLDVAGSTQPFLHLGTDRPSAESAVRVAQGWPS